MHRTVLGIDPGLIVTGYALLGSHNNTVKALDYGHLSMRSNQPIAKRIATFYTFFVKKIIKYTVTHIALEIPFLGKNAHTFLKLGYLRGIVYLLADQHGCCTQEFTPRQVKMGVTGFGAAQKEQVYDMVMRLFGQNKTIAKTVRNDVTDALAVGLCGLWYKTPHNCKKKEKH